MTRFARAKGSKASNEKAPEDATPWEVMKEQLLQAKKENEDVKKRQAAEKQRIENYENFLKDRRVQKRPATWCDFPEVEKNYENTNKSPKNLEQEQVTKKKKINKKAAKKTLNKKVSDEIVANNDVSACTETTKKKKEKKKPFDNINNSTENLVKTDIVLGETSEYSGPPQKRRKQASEMQINQLHGISNTVQPEVKSPRKKRNKKKAAQPLDDSNKNNDYLVPTKSVQNIENKNLGNQIKKIKHKPVVDEAVSQHDSQKTNKQNKDKAKKKKKLVAGKPVRRKEINDKSFQLIIGGKEVELVRYDGFPVMKKDGERLAELNNNMIKKGIPKSEVQRTMKLERRRAEKALARLRREVCYNCRKGGHNLSDCPELKSKIPGADAPEGVCFKCGSTEHRQFECKVQRDKEFRFATCFICKEPGHIARQCPDNPKGLYPNGGSCKLCGDVTHLRKDCPTASNKKEETSVKLHTLDSIDDIEGIGAQIKSATPSDAAKKPKKIKF